MITTDLSYLRKVFNGMFYQKHLSKSQAITYRQYLCSEIFKQLLFILPIIYVYNIKLFVVDGNVYLSLWLKFFVFFDITFYIMKLFLKSGMQFRISLSILDEIILESNNKYKFEEEM